MQDVNSDGQFQKRQHETCTTVNTTLQSSSVSSQIQSMLNKLAKGTGRFRFGSGECRIQKHFKKYIYITCYTFGQDSIYIYSVKPVAEKRKRGTKHKYSAVIHLSLTF